MRHHPPLVLAALLACLMLVALPAASAPGLAGRWTGEMKLPNVFSPLPLHIVLTSLDGSLSGTGGPGPATQYPLEDFRADGASLHATLRVPGEEGDTFVFDLGLAEDRLSGKVTFRNRHGEWEGTATLTREREPKP